MRPASFRNKRTPSRMRSTFFKMRANEKKLSGQNDLDSVEKEVKNAATQPYS